ncbi:ATP-binding protein [Streptomyces sp. NPDC005017]|uniref:ATP-binding protein n=1 Tax=Streptomyces sp. NPDC005017 TaxID=3364706 RepID=UPI0036B1F5B5
MKSAEPSAAGSGGPAAVRRAPAGGPAEVGSAAPVGSPAVGGSAAPVGSPAAIGSAAPTGSPVGGSAAPIGSPSAVGSAAAARQYVRDLVRERWRGPSGPAGEQAVVDLLLVVSELVTNAIRHGGGLARFEVTPVAEGVRLEVHDHSGTVPPAAFGHGTFPQPDASGGFGWPLIIRLAREIHVERRPEGGKAISVLVPLV